MTMKNKSLLLSLAGVLLAASALTALAAGPLTPPGTPGDGSNGGPSLTEVKAAVDALQASDGRTRIPAQTNTYTISQPGNYVLTGNITVASGDGVSITTNNVTLDLNGFAISSTSNAMSGVGIRIANNLQNIRVRNGSILSPSSLSPYLLAGFETAILLEIQDGSVADNLKFEDLSIRGVNQGIIANSATTPPFNTVVQRCQIACNGVALHFGGLSMNLRFGKVLNCEISGEVRALFPTVSAKIVGQTLIRKTRGGGVAGVDDLAADFTFDNRRD